MTFKPFERAEPASQITGCRVGLTKYKNAKSARLIVTIAGPMRKAMELEGTARFEVAIGEDEHHGLMRIRPYEPKGGGDAISVDPRQARGGTFYKLDLGHVGLFVNEPHKAEPVQWEKIEDGWFEFALPKWADATRPRPMHAVSAVPPAVLKAKSAGEADGVREKTERAEAAARRAALAETGEAEERALQLKNPPRALKPFHGGLGLTKSESAVMRILVANRGRVVTRDVLLHELYFDRPDEEPQEKVFDVWICKIRDKLKRLPHLICRIETRHGEGWLLKGSIAGIYDDEEGGVAA